MAIEHDTTYKWLQKNMFAILCAIIAVPLVCILLAFSSYGYKRLAENARHHVEKNMVNMAMYYARKMDFFFQDIERALHVVVKFHFFDDLKNKYLLASILNDLDREHDHFIEDLGVIDSQGNHLSYVGPYDLMDTNYKDDDWFREIMTKKVVASDVFLGHRQVPHLIVAVKVGEGEDFWILRATVSAFRFSSMLDNIRFGRSGEVFIVNNKGVLQTRSRSHGKMLDVLDVDLEAYVAQSGVEVLEINRRKSALILAKTRMSRDNWSLVVLQDRDEALAELLVLRNVFVLLFFLGTALIFVTLYFAAKYLLRKMEVVESEKDLLDEQIIQSQKLASIGQLSAGIAHEINNPLAIIGEEAGWLQDILKRDGMKKIKEYDEFSSSLSEIVQQAGRCREITHKLLSFARKMDSTIKDVDINALLDEVVGMREREAALDDIRFYKEYQSELPLIYSEPSLWRQVFLNLINNAIDAIKKGGAITIKTGLCPEKFDCVVVSVDDTGIGIPKENLDKIFDPFFTTKPPGKGTGLGLSICHGIVQKLGGDITVASNIGQGTTFTVKIPLEPPSNLRDRIICQDMEFITR